MGIDSPYTSGLRLDARRTLGLRLDARRVVAAAALLSCLLVSGCGAKIYPVQGQVVYEDDAPATDLAGYLVMFQSVEHSKSATGTIQADGSFLMGTNTAEDGAMLGKQRVAIAPPPPEIDKPKPAAKIPARFGSFDTSRLEIDIEPHTNQITLKVERSKR